MDTCFQGGNESAYQNAELIEGLDEATITSPSTSRPRVKSEKMTRSMYSLQDSGPLEPRGSTKGSVRATRAKSEYQRRPSEKSNGMLI